MKICLIIDDYLPGSIKVGAKMMHELGVEFVNQGHSVTVITPEPDMSVTSQISELDGVTVCRFHSGEIKNVSKVKRAINETLLSHHAWKAFGTYLQDNTHNIIVYYSPSIFWGKLVSRLKKLWACPGYLILRDFFPQWVIDNGLLRKNSLIIRYFRYFERINYQAADTIGIQSPKNLEWFKKTIQTEKRLDLLYNWAANELIFSKGDHYRRKLGLINKVVYFYGGNIGHAQDMMNIVRLAKNMQVEERAHFVLVGKGDEVELVREETTREGLKNMTLLPPVSQEEFKTMLAEFDVGLFSLHPGHTTHNFPGKLLGYMVAQKPILGSINQGNDLKPLVEGAGAGFVTLNGDDQGLLANALKLLYETKLRKQMGNNGGQLLENTFSVKSAINTILATVEMK